VLTDRINVGGNESGQQTTYTGKGIGGLVLDNQGAPLPGATVTLTPAAGGPPAKRITSAEGTFVFERAAAGDQLEAKLEGFSTVSLTIPASGVGRVIEIRLSPAMADTITVTAEAPLLDERRAGRTETYKMDEGTGGGGRRKRAPAPPPAPSAVDVDAFKDLKKGLVGGVKPLPVAIPETGKLLLLSGVLPPEKISVELEVKAEKERRGWF